MLGHKVAKVVRVDDETINVEIRGGSIADPASTGEFYSSKRDLANNTRGVSKS
jgi:hypothetical protein